MKSPNKNQPSSYKFLVPRRKKYQYNLDFLYFQFFLLIKCVIFYREWLVNYNSIAFILEIFYEKNCRSKNELCTNLIFSYKKILKDFFIPSNLNCIYIIRKIYYIKNYQIKLKIIYYYFSKINTALLFWWCKNGHLAESSIVLI